jgi:LCP family protein required for cell wall assembly
MSDTALLRRKRAALFLAGFVLVLFIVGAAAYPTLLARWKTPLGPGLELPTYTPTTPPTATVTMRVTVGATSTQAVSSGGQTLAPTEIPATDTPAPTATPKPLCGGPPVMMVLGIGADSGEDYRYGLADVIRVARVDFVTPKVTMLSMPRDLWVEIPEINTKYDITHGKLNQAYFYGGTGMGYYLGPGGGPGLLARVLDLNFGLRADHYGAVNMQTFVKIVDAVGGIDIFLPNDVDGRPIDDHTADMGYFRAGQQHFSGEEALRFARIRKKYNDFTRQDHQTMVLCSLREKLLTPSVLPKVPQIIGAFQDAVLTDLTPEQLSQLACLLPNVPRENLIFTSLPAEILSPGRVYSPQLKNETFVMKADYDVIRDYVSRFMSGEWPTEPDEPSCP